METLWTYAMMHQLYEPLEGESGMFAPDRFDSVRAHGFGVAFSGLDILFLQAFEEDSVQEHTYKERSELILRGYGGAGL
jgi:hypothetical protein